MALSLADELYDLDEPPISPTSPSAAFSLADEFGGGVDSLAYELEAGLGGGELEWDELIPAVPEPEGEPLDEADGVDPLDTLDPFEEVQVQAGSSSGLSSGLRGTPRRVVSGSGSRARSEDEEFGFEDVDAEEAEESLREMMGASSRLVALLRGTEGVDERLAGYLGRVEDSERTREEQIRGLEAMAVELEGLDGLDDVTGNGLEKGRGLSNGLSNGHGNGNALDTLAEEQEPPSEQTPTASPLTPTNPESNPLSSATANLYASTTSLSASLLALSDLPIPPTARTTRGIRLALAEMRRRDAEEAACRKAVEAFEADCESGRRVDVRREMGEVVGGFAKVLEGVESRLGTLGRVR